MQTTQQDPLLRITGAVAAGEASWRSARINPKAIAGDCQLTLGQVYRRMNQTEAFLRWLIVTQPVPMAGMLHGLLAEAITAIELQTAGPSSTNGSADSLASV